MKIDQIQSKVNTYKSSHLSQTKWGNQIINIVEVWMDGRIGVCVYLFDMHLYGWSMWFCLNDLLILFYLIGFCSLKIVCMQRFWVIYGMVEYSISGNFVYNMRFLNKSDLLIQRVSVVRALHANNGSTVGNISHTIS